MRNLRVSIPAGRFAGALLVNDLPGLPVERRAPTLAFVESRLHALPGPMSVGVGAVAACVGVFGAVVGHARLARFLGRTAVPVIRDYVRLLRSLSLTYVWETWPGTRPDGTPGAAEHGEVAA